MSFGGSSGGSGSIQTATDVFLSSPSDGQVLSYDSGTLKWVNSTAGGGATTITLADLPPNSILYSSTTTRPTARTDICVMFTSATDPGSAALDGDLWIRPA